MSTATPSLATIFRPVEGLAVGEPVKVVQRGKRRGIVYRDNSSGAFRTKHARTYEEQEAASLDALVWSLIADPAFWSLAMTLPGNTCRTGRRGRPAHNPSWLFLLVAAISTLTGSQRSAITYLNHPRTWRDLRQATRRHRPHGLDGLGRKPPQRHHFSTFLRKWESAAWEAVRLASHERFRADACQRALGGGLFDATKELLYATVDHGQHVVFDGTVFKGPADSRRASANGENWQVKGGRERVWGSKVVFATTRTDDSQSRLVLDFEQVLGTTVSGVGDEAASTITSATRLKAQLPGIRGLIVDSVLRGEHLSQLADQGVIVTNYPHALSNPDARTHGRLGPRRKEKKKQLRTLTHKRPNGTVCQHRLDVVGAVLYTPQYNATGQLVPVECPVVGFDSRRNPSGVHRFYLKVEVPCVHGSFTTKVPLYHEDRHPDAIKGLNRGEYLRFYPPNTPQFQALYGRRNDSESFHRQVKRRLTRLPAYTSERQALFLTGLALASNAATRAFTRRRDGLPNALDETE